MTTQHLRRAFREIGARLVVHEWPDARSPFFRIQVRRPDRFEQFEIEGSDFSVAIADVNVPLRQLLVHAGWKDARSGQDVETRFLCGFDERHWFAAAIPETEHLAVNSVPAAHEALKPEAARASQDLLRVPRHLRNERRNPGFIRQGEWFFIPRPEVSFALGQAQRNVPLQRGLGNPHLVQYLVDTRGTSRSLWFDGPSGESDRKVYARGTVRHRDHRTIKLPFWHQVELSGEPATSVGWGLD